MRITGVIQRLVRKVRNCLVARRRASNDREECSDDVRRVAERPHYVRLTFALVIQRRHRQ